jgi:hypothetical protein
MKCCRCGSMMVAEKFYLWHEYFSGWRCIGCGDIIDPQILDNRSRLRKRVKCYVQKPTEAERSDLRAR